MIRQLAHLCFHTRRIDEMVAFYRDCLGLPIKFTMETDDGQTFGYYFACGNTSFIEIFDHSLAVKKWGGQEQEMTQGTQYKHFCLEVTGIEAFKRLLESRGVEVTNIKSGLDHSRQAWIKDPDGNAIELMEYNFESRQLQR